MLHERCNQPLPQMVLRVIFIDIGNREGYPINFADVAIAARALTDDETEFVKLSVINLR